MLKMDIHNQTQKSGDSCLNVQAENVTVHSGLTYSDVKAMMRDTFEENFYKLAGVAKEVAQQRAEEITNEYIAKLQKDNPDGLVLTRDPGMQHAIVSAQIEYAKTGDRDLGDILVDILVDRSKERERNLKQIVLNESLLIVPKLTKEQLNAISLIFILGYTRSNTVNSIETLNHYLAHTLAPFSTSISKTNACYQHIEFTGCGSVSLGSKQIEKIFKFLNCNCKLNTSVKWQQPQAA